MPLPDFGYSNRETRKKQELVFPMAPGTYTVWRPASRDILRSIFDMFHRPLG